MIVLTGPVFQQVVLTSIFIRFYTFKRVADIIKMYRLIKVDFLQTRYQRIFWRDNNNSRLEVYELTTVTYGIFAVSFLVTKCLTHLADIYADSYLVDSLHVAHDFYVDLLTTYWREQTHYQKQ